MSKDQENEIKLVENPEAQPYENIEKGQERVVLSSQSQKYDLNVKSAKDQTNDKIESSSTHV